MIYRHCMDLQASAQMTYNNMCIYYAQFAPDWDSDKIHQQIVSLDNWDIIDGEEVVGAIRLEFDEHTCFLRDLQVNSTKQNKGIGAEAIKFVIELALQNHCETLVLKVFKVSPAGRLYRRLGFKVTEEDERFYFMSLNIA